MQYFNHESKAEVGEVIRSYDFQPMSDRPESYIEGIVIKKTDSSFVIAVQNRVFAGESEQAAVGETVETPFQMFFGEFDNRIQSLGAIA